MAFNGIGDMRYRVVLQTRSEGPGAVTWSNTATVWAAVAPAGNPSETSSPSGLRTLLTYVVRMRTRTVAPSQQLVWNGKTLQITGVRPGLPGYIDALCVETD
jgi:hypothetical protein